MDIEEQSYDEDRAFSEADADEMSDVDEDMSPYTAPMYPSFAQRKDAFLAQQGPTNVNQYGGMDLDGVLERKAARDLRHQPAIPPVTPRSRAQKTLVANPVTNRKVPRTPKAKNTSSTSIPKVQDVYIKLGRPDNKNKKFKSNSAVEVKAPAAVPEPAALPLPLVQPAAAPAPVAEPVVASVAAPAPVALPVPLVQPAVVPVPVPAAAQPPVMQLKRTDPKARPPVSRTPVDNGPAQRNVALLTKAMKKSIENEQRSKNEMLAERERKIAVVNSGAEIMTLANQEIANLNKSKGELEATVERLKTRNRELQDLKHKAEEHAAQVVLEAKNNTDTALEQQRLSLIDQFKEQATKAIDDLKSKAQANYNEAIRQKNEALNSEAQALRELATANDRISLLSQNGSTESEEIRGLQRLIETWKTTSEQQAQRIRELRQTIEDSKTTSQELKNQLRQAETDRDIALQEVESLKNRVDVEMKPEPMPAAPLAPLQPQAPPGADDPTINKGLADSQAKVAQLTKEVERLKEELKKPRVVPKVSTSEQIQIAKLTADLTSREEELKKAKDDSTDNQQEMLKLADEARILIKEKADAIKELGTSKLRINELEREIDALLNELDQMDAFVKTYYTLAGQQPPNRPPNRPVGGTHYASGVVSFVDRPEKDLTATTELYTIMEQVRNAFRQLTAAQQAAKEAEARAAQAAAATRAAEAQAAVAVPMAITPPERPDGPFAFIESVIAANPNSSYLAFLKAVAKQRTSETHMLDNCWLPTMLRRYFILAEICEQKASRVSKPSIVFSPESSVQENGLAVQFGQQLQSYFGVTEWDVENTEFVATPAAPIQIIFMSPSDSFIGEPKAIDSVVNRLNPSAKDGGFSVPHGILLLVTVNTSIQANQGIRLPTFNSTKGAACLLYSIAVTGPADALARVKAFLEAAQPIMNLSFTQPEVAKKQLLQLIGFLRPSQ